MRRISKKTIFLIVLVIILSFSVSAFAADKKAKAVPKVAVKQLGGKGVDADTAATLTEVLCTRLMKHKKHQVLCSSDVRAILNATQQTAMLGNCDDDACLQKLGKVLDTPYILNGSIGKVGDSYIISLSLLATEDKKVVKRVTHEASGNLIKAIREAVDQLAK